MFASSEETGSLVESAFPMQAPNLPREGVALWILRVTEKPGTPGEYVQSIQFVENAVDEHSR